MNCNCGIYVIVCLVNHKKYIGSSVNIERRWKSHLYNLRKNYHCNYYLQSDWNEYGEDNFQFDIVEICSEDCLIQRESFYVNNYKCLNRKFGYNIIDPIIGWDAHKKSSVSDTDIEIMSLLLRIGCSVNRISVLLHVNYCIVKTLQSKMPLYYNVDISSSVKQLKDLGFDIDSILNENVWSQISAIPLRMLCNEYHILCMDCCDEGNINMTEYIKNENITEDKKINITMKLSLNDILLFLNSDKPAFFKKLFIVLLLVSKENGGHIPISKHQILKLVGEGIKSNYHNYDCCIFYLLQKQLIELKDCFLYIPFDGELSTDEDFKIVDRINSSKCRFDLCQHCGCMYVQNKNGTTRYCTKHRGYKKNKDIEKICTKCGSLFTFHSYTKRNMCESCYKYYRNSGRKKIKNL